MLLFSPSPSAAVMKLTKYRLLLLLILSVIVLLSMTNRETASPYFNLYLTRLSEFQQEQEALIQSAEAVPDFNPQNIELLKKKIGSVRLKLKAIDFWLRYLEPVAYKKINGPLPLEWETEVFEKFEKPYKRQGAGLILATLYLDGPAPKQSELLRLLQQSDEAINIFRADSVTIGLVRPGDFFFANRLFLLNLSAIYTTGFECPVTDNIIEELQAMLKSVKDIYTAFNKSFAGFSLPGEYLQLYEQAEDFVASGDKDYTTFDHFHFIKDYVNPLYSINQQLIRKYGVFSRSYNDYSLNNDNNSIFDKNLYNGQNGKGVFISVDDAGKLNEIKSIGKLLFFDPILSGNGKRSCANCHKPDQYFNDTTVKTNEAFNETTSLLRNTPSLLNVVYNHLLMLDGKHISLQNQAKDVITSPGEMGCDAKKVVGNVMSCDTYKKAFLKFKKLTPLYPDVTIDHIVSAITLYYSDFSQFDSPFDRTMNNKGTISDEAVKGFNVFMSKAQCATCHFVPQFNGVKPPYIGSEFEVLGVPDDTTFKKVSVDSGRYAINSAAETLHAFRTGSIRNGSFTKPYMHNGVFKTMDEVIDFYDSGGGAGKGLKIENQTLPGDSLHLTKEEKAALKAFIKTLDENIVVTHPPEKLPATRLEAYKSRKVGGEY